MMIRDNEDGTVTISKMHYERLLRDSKRHSETQRNLSRRHMRNRPTQYVSKGDPRMVARYGNSPVLGW